MFVGNLSFDTARSELQELFSQVGEVVDVYLPSDRSTGRPRGFAFVEYTDEPSAMKAIERFDGYALQNRNLRVNAAEDHRPRRPTFTAAPPEFQRDSRPRKSKGSRRNLRARKRSL